MSQLSEHKIDRGKALPVNSVTQDETTLEQARDYERKRFTRQRNRRKLDRFEKVFALRLLDKVGRNSHVVDIPCGSGRFYEIFSAARELTMIDCSDNMLTVAAERTSGATNVEFLRADITNLPLPASCAELCFCMRLFHHMKTDEVRVKALSELARISKRYVALSFYNKRCFRYYLRKMLGKKIRGNYITYTHLISLAGQAALFPVERFPKINFTEQQCLVILQKVQDLDK